ncbi:MAG: AbrB/MazE/SpoVT family DNA-binding domain-containing protein [Clostridia bacterium]|nr:AbrB/MazE/SpoVT family DNA-binding domain-containing protein [Clostridia bacterium]
MLKVTVSAKGQIVIPASLRRQLGLKNGDRVALEPVDGAILLRPVPRHPLLAMRGTLKTVGEEKLTAVLLRERALDRERENR